MDIGENRCIKGEKLFVYWDECTGCCFALGHVDGLDSFHGLRPHRC